MNLFQLGDFTLSSGEKSFFKIECDALTDLDIQGLARIIRERYKFKRVAKVSTGGDRLFEALKGYEDKNERITLIVEDVLNTGKSITKVRDEVVHGMVGTAFADIVGVAIFARIYPPDWVYPIFQMW